MPGPIQNAINQASATVAGAVIGVKHVQEKEDLAEEQGLLAKEQYHEANADLIGLKNEQQEAEKVINSKKAKLTDKQAAQLAFDELSDRIEAKLAMQSRAEKIMKRTGTWGGVR